MISRGNLFSLYLLFAFPWICGSETNLSIECTSCCAKISDELVAARAENAMLRSLVRGAQTQNRKTQPRETKTQSWEAMVYEHMEEETPLHQLDRSLIYQIGSSTEKIVCNPVERLGIQSKHGCVADDGNSSTVIESALQPLSHFSRTKAGTPRQAATYTVVSSFFELVTAVGSHITVDITADIIFEETIGISGVLGLVIMSSTGTVFDGRNEVQIFNISSSTVEFHNITFTNGYTDEYGGALYLHSSTTIIVNSTFHSNSADSGGAVYCHASNVAILSSTFKSNTATSV